jgi:hypothetical protein
MYGSNLDHVFYPSSEWMVMSAAAAALSTTRIAEPGVGDRRARRGGRSVSLSLSALRPVVGTWAAGATLAIMAAWI